MGSNRLNRTASRRGGPLTSAVKLTSSLRWFSECQRLVTHNMPLSLAQGYRKGKRKIRLHGIINLCGNDPEVNTEGPGQ